MTLNINSRYPLLQDLIGDVSSCKQLEVKISLFESEKDKGDAFEEFCEAYFILDPMGVLPKVKTVFRKIPPTIAAKLGYPGVQDIGIDGVIETSEGELYAYQAKFRRDRNNTPSLRELSTFYTMSDKADYRFVITNANKLSDKINKRVNQGRITASNLDMLDKDFFDKLRKLVTENVVDKPKKTSST